MNSYNNSPTFLQKFRSLVSRLFIRLLIMEDYSLAEIVDIIKIVGLCNDNLRAAEKIYTAMH